MNSLEKYLSISPMRSYYEEKIKTLSDTDLIRLENLIQKLEKSGANNPLPYAISEITEGIPQFGRFLVMKELYMMIERPKDAIEYAIDVSEGFEEELDAIQREVGDERLMKLLQGYSRGMTYRFIDLLEGNSNAEEDDVSWALLQTDNSGNHTEQLIQGLHEDFMEFSQEIL